MIALSSFTVSIDQRPRIVSSENGDGNLWHIDVVPVQCNYTAAIVVLKTSPSDELRPATRLLLHSQEV